MARGDLHSTRNYVGAGALARAAARETSTGEDARAYINPGNAVFR
jgi:hypothetical protein